MAATSGPKQSPFEERAMSTPMTTKESEVDAPVMDDNEVVRVARALCKHTADACNTDAEDEWTIYSDDFKQMASVAITALRNAGVKV
jgi:hypothetical protein